MVVQADSFYFGVCCETVLFKQYTVSLSPLLRLAAICIQKYKFPVVVGNAYDRIIKLNFIRIWRQQVLKLFLLWQVVFSKSLQRLYVYISHQFFQIFKLNLVYYIFNPIDSFLTHLYLKQVSNLICNHLFVFVNTRNLLIEQIKFRANLFHHNLLALV